MAGETETPNIGLQVPGFNQANWQVPTNFNWNLLDLIFGGEVTVPTLTVENLNVTNFTIANLTALLMTSFVSEIPIAGVGNTYLLSQPSGVMLAFCINGLVQRPGVDYTVLGSTITTTFTVPSGATVYAVYFSS